MTTFSPSLGWVLLTLTVKEKPPDIRLSEVATGVDELVLLAQPNKPVRARIDRIGKENRKAFFSLFTRQLYQAFTTVPSFG